MNILTQRLKNINDFTQPILDPTDPFNYAKLVQDMNLFSDNFCRQLLKETLEKYDYEFINTPNRTDKYYVKNTRNRTIITINGPVTYRRTEYRCRSTGTYYCPADIKAGLFPRQTIHNFLKRVKSIETPVSPSKDTPETLYVMADVKFIPIQKRKMQRYLYRCILDIYYIFVIKF
ncbi:MAG: hypothetical protein GXZ13_07140 [Synergistaceae bacterium]|nr:hypothetical protein [Synergistaceae bacterium]NLY87110.1 hypothetical protein [Clostridiales bacterium]